MEPPFRNEFSCSPPSLAEVQTRPNVIQNPVHRPVPTRLASLPAPSPVRPSPLNPLSLFQDYFRRTQQLSKCCLSFVWCTYLECCSGGGGLWVPQSAPAAAATAATAAATTRITASGRPNDAQPILAATAGSGFGNYNGIYGTQVRIQDLGNTYHTRLRPLSLCFSGGEAHIFGCYPRIRSRKSFGSLRWGRRRRRGVVSSSSVFSFKYT